jgi:putative ABC transport system permease protein
VGEEADLLTAHVTPRSLIVSYCLGAVLTFITVAISSSRVSRLNIVAAVRGTDDVHARETKRRTHWLWVALGLPALVIPPLGIWLLLRKGFGLPNAWVWGPIGILAGAFLLFLGQSNNSLFFFSMGMSLVPLALAGIVRYLGAPARAVWSAVGGYLAVYWLMPNELHEALFGTLDGNIEMFVLSGIMIVIGLTLLIVFNARFLTGLFTRSGDASRAYAATVGLVVAAVVSAAAAALLGDRGNGVGQVLYMVAGLLVFAGVLAFAAARFPKLGPALKMGVAYPIANRFRTGMTIAMFSLIVFSIVVMSTLTANFSAIYAGDEAKGGWDVIAESSRTNPVPDLVAALNEEGSFDTSQIQVAARASSQEVSSEVRQAGREKWENYPVRAADDTFFAANEAKLDMRARGYETDEAVYEAVRTTPGLAVMDAMPIPSDDFGSTGWQVKGIEAGDEVFEPFQVEMRDPVTGKAATVTVIGVFSSKLPWGLMSGIYTNAATFTPVFGEPDARTTFLRLAPGTDGEAAAKGIKAALLTKGVQTLSLQERIDTDAAESKGFTRIFQLFMGLGLFVGIAALGVIAFRSVVERRQQIGMLRAIGYQRGTVALTFLFESSFIALMGILSGVVGAAILSRNLMTSEDFAGTSTTGFDFFIPWDEVVAFVAIAYVFSLLLTWWPSRGAAKVPVAEALRYE